MRAFVFAYLLVGCTLIVFVVGEFSLFPWIELLFVLDGGNCIRFCFVVVLLLSGFSDMWCMCSFLI